MKALRVIAVAVGLLLANCTFAAEPLRIALIDPLSGAFANIGESTLKHAQMAVDRINARGGVLGGQKLEIVAFDSKGNPQDAALALRQVADQGIHYVLHAASSAVGAAILDGVAKHNSRNPDNVIIYLNHGAIDPTLTNERCNFWHFRFDAHQLMKIQAFTDAMARDKKMHKVYLINQDYNPGQLMSRETRAMLARKRPDVEIVGDDLHPIGKIKDFAPYVAKIKASGADTVATNNWGSDIALLIKAAKETGLNVSWYAMYVYLIGTPAAMGDPGNSSVTTLLMWHPNIPGTELEAYANAYKLRFKEDWGWLPSYVALHMLVQAVEQVKSTEPLKVALAMEDMKYAGPTGEVWMRREDHQLMQPIYVANFVKVGREGTQYDAEGTGFGWHTEQRIEVKDTILPHTCKMERP